MSEYRPIDIDLDVHRRIEFERQSFSETPNEVLRRLLKIDVSFPTMAPKNVINERPWAAKGVNLPHGTNLHMEYNSRVHTGIIDNGAWIAEGKSFASPSAAASGVAITKDGQKTNLDGWTYWQVKRPGDDEWVRLSDLRHPRHKKVPSLINQEDSKKMTLHQELGASDLPPESSVIVALEEFLTSQIRPVTPTEVYRALGDKFGLSVEQRNREMPNSEESHWQNRVRFAVRKLKDADKIDRNLPRGQWRIKNNPL